MRWFVGLVLVLGVVSCGGESKKAVDDVSDGISSDLLGDVSPDLTSDVVPDTGIDVVDPDVLPSECLYSSVPQDTPDLQQKKFALTMFHFNIQYVVRRPGRRNARRRHRLDVRGSVQGLERRQA